MEVASAQGSQAGVSVGRGRPLGGAELRQRPFTRSFTDEWAPPGVRSGQTHLPRGQSHPRGSYHFSSSGPAIQQGSGPQLLVSKSWWSTGAGSV